MKKIKSAECKCGLSFHKNLMIGNKCYLCVLGQWPPKTRKQLKDYEKAVSIRLSLATPLNLSQGEHVTKRIGLDKLQTLQDLIDGKIVGHKPNSTFYQRTKSFIEAVNNGK